MAPARLVGLHDGPRELTLARHGQSLGNLADAAARDAGADRLDLKARDADVKLSDTGYEQAQALGRWLTGHERPTLVVSSPYERAFRTATEVMSELGIEVVLDERLRERDLGLFDGLTGQGIRTEYAGEAERRSRVGKFYYQPPSGESWADVVLRVRSLLQDLRHGHQDARVWMFTHQAVIMSFRYVLEGLTEQELLDIDKSSDIANCSLTTYRHDGAGLVLERFADASVLEDTEADVTNEPSGRREGRGGESGG
ncbi:histidine phosphatase family protein [Nocardioides mesophilus]|uniref:phosphoglycerate mutase (2,3-diphosphoglycerate-dependent) n=1 Tax=Nocardioides mesophilus TaxID=433659 RepID=A0A7G9RB54_9ACTN|nr:histidine phosphatase family protein [Nocardioides mesophilus]QNN52829.1 histidine phosphatase family protein [Nocardioides mesophilus]